MKRIRTALVGVVAAACVVTGTVSAQADPDSVSKAKSELEKIQQDSSKIDAQITDAYVASAKAKKKLKLLKTDLAAQESKVDAMTKQLGQAAALQQNTTSVSLAAQLLTSSHSDNFLSGLATMQAEIDRSNAGVQQLQLDQAKLQAMKQDASDTLAVAQAQAKAKEKLKKDYKAKEAEAQAVYNRLSAQERTRLAALEQQDAQSDADRAARASRSEDRGADVAVAPEDAGRLGTVVSAALSRVGGSYVHGAEGLRNFDCSGLTMWAYAKMGISLPHSARIQSGMGRAVSTSSLQPGDLIFYYSPVSHVAMYIGGGRIVHAANPRVGIQTASAFSMPIAGARRLVG